MLHAEGFAGSLRCMKLTAALLLAASLIAQAEVKVAARVFSDKRVTGSLPARLSLQFRLSGPEIAECKGVRFAIDEMKDEAGNVVELDDLYDHWFGRDSYLRLPNHCLDAAEKDQVLVTAKFENPNPRPRALSINGEVDILIPSKKPGGLSVDIEKHIGKVVELKALKAAGVTIDFKTPPIGELRYAGSGPDGFDVKEVSYSITDPNKRVAFLEFYSSDGKIINPMGWQKRTFTGQPEVTINYFKELPKKAKIYLVTEKSVTRVPVKLNVLLR